MKYLNTKPGSIEEIAANMSKHQTESGYQDMFKKELEKAGKGIGSMTPAEKKAFFNKIDDKYKAKSEGGPGSGPQGGETRGTYNTGHKKSVMKPGAGKRPGSAKDGGQTDKEADDYDNEMGEKKEVVKEARFEVEGRVDYKDVSGGDDFTIIIDAKNEKDAEDKVSDMLFKHRNQRKIGPSGGRGVDDYEIESITRTSKSVTNKFFTYHAAEKDPTIKEAVREPYAVGMAQAMKATGDKPPLEKSTIKKAHDIAKAIKKDEVNETHMSTTADMNQSKKDAKGEKEIVDPEPKLKQESIQDAIANVWKMSAEELEKIKTEAKYMKAQRMGQYKAEDEKKEKGIADTGSKETKVDVEPKVDYKN